MVTVLYDAYVKWFDALALDDPPLAKNPFGEKLEAKGFPSSKSDGVRYRKGIRLRRPEEVQTDSV